ncbi:nitroreductase family protein [Marinicella gelatinilytica]|uniref:nitroreductase family protein n=1 Tax=Marinicella gelatinilytica TaxID=2996017 RepID=UPI002260FC44|nr:nitroreductase [Marinicella gelatinilytica]MCX7544144.1 nitroreductase [Marinicella gelatinilytica]
MSKRTPNPEVIEFLQNRRSVLIKHLTEPGPNDAELNTILTIATRVPDHRKLEPWRLLVIRGEGRDHLGQKLADIRAKKHDLIPQQLEIEANNFKRAPLVIAVVSSPQEGNTPIEEQTCSGAVVAQHINLAAAALGYASQWVTGWSCLDKDAQKALGLADHEWIIGYVYIGSTEDLPADRARPDLADKVTYFV